VGGAGDLCQQCRHEAADAVRRAAAERAEQARSEEEERKRQRALEEEQREQAARERAEAEQRERARQEEKARREQEAREEDARREKELRDRAAREAAGSTADFDPHQVLGVPKDATPDMIREAYEQAMAKYQPDQFGFLNDELQAMFEKKAKAVQRAYQMLTGSTETPTLTGQGKP
jgi:DnaJ-domain-containing protein 1